MKIHGAEELIEIAERRAEGTATRSEVYDAFSALRIHEDGVPTSRFSNGDVFQAFTSHNPFISAVSALTWARRHEFGHDDDVATQSCVKRLHDIIGNPFHRVIFDPAWRTDTVLTLARQMYDSREFGAMPILADALQDAGCDNDDVLNHCREANATHVRGCWVVDMVLGKE